MNLTTASFGADRFPPASASLHPHHRIRMAARLWVSAWCLLSAILGWPLATVAATFPGNVRVEIPDPTGGLSWSTATNALTVQCWFKLSIPSGITPTENMTILVNRRTGTTSDAYAYHLFYDITRNSIEFATRGKNGVSKQETLLPAPFQDRWYHLAIVRDGIALKGYVDGRETTYPTLTVGDSGSTNGLSIGGWGTVGTGQYLYGEIQEVSVFQGVRSVVLLKDFMFKDQPVGAADLKAYYKMSFSQSPANRLSNLALNKPSTTEGTAYPTDTLVYEETDREGEQSAFDAGKNGGTGAISPLSGSFSWEQTALARPTPGVPFELRFGYSSANAAADYQQGGTDPSRAGPLNNRWRHSFETRILPTAYFGSDTVIGLLLWNGAIETWTNVEGTYTYETRRKNYRGAFSVTASNCVWVTPDNLVYTFRPRNSEPASMQGRLISIRDYNNNEILFEYDVENTGDLTRVVHSSGAEYVFQYRSDKLLETVSCGLWNVRFDYDANKRLISKLLTNSSGIYTNVPATWRFNYYTSGASSNLLRSIVDPRGNTNVVVAYDLYGRRTGTTNALGRASRVAYGVPGTRQITTTDAEGFLWISTHDRSGRIVAQQDPFGNISRSTYDERGNRISAIDALGNTTLYAYDNRANLIAMTNALGQVVRRTYHSLFSRPTADIDPLGWTTHYDIDDATGNLLRRWDDLGTLASYTYTNHGLISSQTDANGHTTRFAYVNDLRVQAQDPAGFITRFLPNELGWNLAITNALGEVTTYGYDINGKVVLTVDALSRVRQTSYDSNGNLVSQTDAKGQVMRYAYDPANQKTNEVDRVGAVKRFYYTPRGKPAAVVSALNQTNTFSYDAANRPAVATDALGNSVTTIFDANGNAVAVVDELAQRWARTFDRLNRVVASADPFGNTTQTLYDSAGRVRENITPKGSHAVSTYDGRNRLIQWVDATGSTWRYDYDPVGNITKISDAMGGQYVMEYGLRNERTLERNQDGKEWHYTYDALQRLKTQIDPNGTQRTLAYDEGGRVTTVNFSTGRLSSFLYDDNDNPIVLTRSGSGPATISQLTYDPLDRVEQYTDAFSKSIQYTYDPAGRITNLTYPDGKMLAHTYDALNRVTSQSFKFGAAQPFATTYTYDKAGHLARRTYPNGIVQTNTFDAAGRLIGISHSSDDPQPTTLDAALTYAYDRNGNTSRRTEHGMFEWPMPSLRDERSQFTPAGLITNRIDVLAPTNHFTYQHDPNGNMTNAFGTGQSWMLTYDEDNRTTSIRWEAGVTSKLITNRFDALGRRISKTVDGVACGYVLDLARGMERILCDLTSTRAIAAWYVHGPDLAFKVTPDGALTCYHADAQGNIIALTDGLGNTVAQYAYTPYGRSLGSTNSPAHASNPYLFVGSHGVMEELPSLYFMRARYYSAEAGVFLSTEPLRHIGPTWRPIAHAYARGNPLRYSDPTGEWAVLDQAWAGIKEFGTDAWDAITWTASEAWDWLKPNVVQPIWQELKGGAEDLWDMLKSIPENTWSSLKSTYAQLKSAALYLWDKLPEFWENLTDKDWWVQAGQNLTDKDWWLARGEDIRDFIVDDVVGGITEAWQEDVKPVLEDVWEGIKDVGRTIAGWFGF